MNENHNALELIDHNKGHVAPELLDRDKINQTPNSELSMAEVVTIVNHVIC